MIKIRKKIIILLVILIIALIGSTWLLNGIEKKAMLLVPDNMWVVAERYKGEFSADEINKHIRKFSIEVIPDYYKKVNNNILDYYNKNSKSIKAKTGIDTKTDFEDIINKIKEQNVQELIFDSYIILCNSIKVQNKCVNGTLVIKYKGCDEIAFDIILNNNKTDKIPVICKINQNLTLKEIKDELEYENQFNPETISNRRRCCY